MEIKDSEIWTVLKKYAKDHPSHYFMYGKEFIPKNFRYKAPTIPFSKEECDEGFDVTIEGSCLFDDDMQQQKEFRFDCRAHVAIIDNKETVTKIENDRINIKNK